jgi:flagellar basal body rod protein FlgC
MRVWPENIANIESTKKRKEKKKVLKKVVLIFLLIKIKDYVKNHI